MVFCILILCFGSLWLSSFAHALEVPKLQGYVNDYAGMISPPVREQVENELRAFEKTDSTQIVILTIPSLEGEDLEEFSIKVAETWKVGQQGKDNGVIFLVSKQDRKIRIEVGRGLEGRLTDLTAGRIIDLVVKPRFKRGDFDGGLIAGVHALIDGTRGEFKADKNQQRQKRDVFGSIISLLLFSTIIMLVLGSISRILGGIAGAVLFPGLVRLTPISPGIIIYAISAIVGFGAGLFLTSIFSSHRKSYRDSGFWFGGSGFGGGSGGFSSGGFSGGGGGFGGGGASGGW